MFAVFCRQMFRSIDQLRSIELYSSMFRCVLPQESIPTRLCVVGVTMWRGISSYFRASLSNQGNSPGRSSLSSARFAVAFTVDSIRLAFDYRVSVQSTNSQLLSFFAESAGIILDVKAKSQGMAVLTENDKSSIIAQFDKIVQDKRRGVLNTTAKWLRTNLYVSDVISLDKGRYLTDAVIDKYLTCCKNATIETQICQIFLRSVRIL